MSNQILDANKEPLDPNLLIESNMGLVVSIVKKFKPKPHLYDEYLQIGTIGLWEAIKHFKPERNRKLSTYAWRCIVRHLVHHIEKENKYYHRHSELSEVNESYVNLNELIESLPEYLSEDEQLVLRDRLSNMSLKQIAEKNNIKRSRVIRTLNSAIKKIRVANNEK